MKRELELVRSEPAEESPEEITSEEIDSSFVPQLRAEVAVLEVDGEAVILDERSWELHWLDQYGAIVLKCFDGSGTLDELSADIADVFDADPEVVRNDVLGTARRLGGAGLLEGVAKDPEPDHARGPQGVEIGTEIPSASFADLDGQPVAFEDLVGERLLLVNWSPYCGFCEKITPELAEMEPALRKEGVRLVLVSIGEPEDNRKLVQDKGLEALVLVQQDGGWEFFSGLGTPVAYLVDGEGRTESEISFGANEVPRLARAAAGLPEEEGQPADPHDHDHEH
jgi:thiol-disulfide isomerase/thioredoxin